MICALVEPLLDLHALNRLAPPQARWVASHLSACASCAAEAAAWKAMLEGLRAAPAPAAPADLKAALKKAAAAAAPRPAPARDFADDWRPASVPSLALAAGFAAFLLSVSVSILGPGLASQACSDAPASVCIAPFASQSPLR
jgi:anti-sigma factor RsiW